MSSLLRGRDFHEQGRHPMRAEDRAAIRASRLSGELSTELSDTICKSQERLRRRQQVRTQKMLLYYGKTLTESLERPMCRMSIPGGPASLQVHNRASQPVEFGIQQGQLMIVDQPVGLVLHQGIQHLLRHLRSLASDQLIAFLEQRDGLARLQVIEKEEAGIHLAKLRRMGAQCRAQKAVKIAAPLLRNVVNRPLAGRQLVVGRSRPRSLDCLLAHLQIAIVRQPLKLVIDGRLLDKVRKEGMVVLDDLAR